MEKYTEKIINEVKKIPEEAAPEFYRKIRLLRTEFLNESRKKKRRGSLRGIWKGIRIGDELVEEAKRSLFAYEAAGKYGKKK
jgi:mRNA-degrading endonuclease RelE of RelBE toxin-antitoxin system